MKYRKGIALGEHENLNRYPPWPQLKTIEQYGEFGMVPDSKPKQQPYYMGLYGDDVVVVNTPQ